MNNKYKRLISNSVAFAVGNIFAKAIAFIMVPFYTYILTKRQYGLIDVLVNTSNILVPVVTLSIFDAVFRYAMDKTQNKNDVFSNGIFVTLIGLLCCFIFLPVFEYFQIPYAPLFILMVGLNAIQTLFQNFTRAIDEVSSFVISGLINAGSLALLNIFFLWILQMGVDGYLLAFICSSLLTSAFLYCKVHLKKYISVKRINLKKVQMLLKYSLPLIPNSLSWWMTNGATRYLILFFIGISSNGLYAVAGQIPAIITVFFSVFTQAWQMSAVEEFGKKNTSEFYTSVFNHVYVVLVMLTASVILILKPAIKLIFASSYYNSWKIVPFLLIASIFSNLSSFIGTVYLATKKTNIIFTTTIIGMIMNIVIGALTLPVFGVTVAGVGASVGFFAIFLIRFRHSYQFVKIKISKVVFSTNMVLIIMMCVCLWIAPILNIFFFIILSYLNRYILKNLISFGMNIIRKMTIRR